MSPPTVALVAKREPGMTGTVRYAEHLHAALARSDLAVIPGEPTGPPFGRLPPTIAGRLDAFFATYPTGLRLPAADLLHLTVQTLTTGLLTTRWRGRLVVTVHDVIPFLTRHDRALRAYAHPVHELFDRLSLRLLRRADLLTVDSAWTADTVAEGLGYPRERIRVVPLGVDHARFRVDGPSHPLVEEAAAGEGPLLVYVGSLSPRKNVPALIRAMPLIRARAPGVRLLAAGPGDPAAVLRLRAELGLEDAVSLLGTVPDDALAPLYRRATVVVVPSLYEGFGLPALEAMACGAPVVAAGRTSLPEVVGDAGVLCEPTPDGIARAAVDLLLDPARRERLGAAAAERARDFTWERTAALTRAAYAEALDR